MNKGDYMQWEHCGFCGNISLKKIDNGMKKCPRCDWEGFPDTNGMEKINALAKQYKPGMKWAPPIKARIKEPVEGVDEIEGAGSELEETENCEEQQNQEPVQKSLNVPSAQQEQRKSSFRMSDEEAFKSENRIGNREVSNKVPANQALLDRLKSKNIKGADFL